LSAFEPPTAAVAPHAMGFGRTRLANMGRRGGKGFFRKLEVMRRATGRRKSKAAKRWSAPVSPPALRWFLRGITSPLKNNTQ